MNQSRKVDCKKVFVRNTEQKVPKTTVTKKTTKKITEPVPKHAVDKIQNTDEVFSFPIPNFSSDILKNIKRLESEKPTHTKQRVRGTQVPIDDKVTKRVNFPNDKPIYKDLIPLCVKLQSQPMISSREPLPMRDKEPILSDFIRPKEHIEYRIPVRNNLTDKSSFISSYDGLRLYRLMQNW